IAVLPPSEDADSFIRKQGAEAFGAAPKNAESAVAFQVRALSARENCETEVGAMRIARAVLETVAASPNAVQRARLIQEAAKALDIPATALQEEYRRMTARQQTRAAFRATDARSAPAGGAYPEHPREEVEFCEHIVHAADFPEMRVAVERYLPIEMIEDPVCRTVVRCALQALVDGVDVQEMLNREEDRTGELQRFAAQILMAPSKTIGAESSRVDAVKDLILFLWRRRLQKERDSLKSDDPVSLARRSQLTYDLKGLRNWADGSAIIRVKFGS
ncbi:MAG: hypothetical protein QME60_07945, partial [Verrucomicrobiota bacterium]|nr:hypothetical protein [Verrucomicrobiota bacterium]